LCDERKVVVDRDYRIPSLEDRAALLAVLLGSQNWE
jgi:hypothetical protein